MFTILWVSEAENKVDCIIHNSRSKDLNYPLIINLKCKQVFLKPRFLNKIKQNYILTEQLFTTFTTH